MRRSQPEFEPRVDVSGVVPTTCGMAIRRKGKRSIVVDGAELLWWVVAQDGDPHGWLLCVARPNGEAFASYRLPLAPDDELFPDGPPGQITPRTVERLIRHRPLGDRSTQLRYDTVALDLEGTLISNAMSQFPRAGLFELLERCHEHVPRVVMYTAVAERLFRPIADRLVREELAPAWFADIDYVDWSGPHKDLTFIEDCDPSRALLVDDNPGYVEPSQRSQWIQVPEFAAPYEEDDALRKVWDWIKYKNGKSYAWP